MLHPKFQDFLASKNNIRPSTQVALASDYIKSVALLLMIHFSCFPSCLYCFVFGPLLQCCTLCPFKFCNHLTKEERLLYFNNVRALVWF